MLHRDIVVLHLFDEAFSGGEDLIHIGGDIDLVRLPTGPGDSRQAAISAVRSLRKAVRSTPFFFSSWLMRPLVLPGEGAQQVELFDLHIGVLGRQTLGSRDRLQRFLV